MILEYTWKCVVRVVEMPYLKIHAGYYTLIVETCLVYKHCAMALIVCFRSTVCCGTNNKQTKPKQSLLSVDYSTSTKCSNCFESLGKGVRSLLGLKQAT
jgi:hypothetical protein